MKTRAAVLLASACFAGCAPSLTEIDDGTSTEVSAVTTESKDGVFSTLVSAIDSEVWVHFSFDTGEEAFVVDSATSRDWDLRFSRFNIRVNSGVSGPGEVGLAILPHVSFDGLGGAPGGDYETDRPDGDADGDDELAFRKPNDASENGWFLYEPRFHTVSPADVCYVVKAMNGVFYKLELTAYYDEHGEAGFPKFRWAAVAAP